MNDVVVFLSGIGLTLIASFFVVRFLKTHLHRILVDLCGTEDRASFWTVFSIVILVLAPLIATLSIRPQPGQDVSIVYLLGDQILGGLIGLAGSVIILGIILSRFIPPLRAANPSARADSSRDSTAGG